MQTKHSVDNVFSLHDEAVEKLRWLLKTTDDSFTDGEMMRIKGAMTSFNGTAREMATWRAKEAVQLGIIRELTKDKDEIRKYVKATMPEYYPDDED